jgi:thiamine-monophosphate kinase
MAESLLGESPERLALSGGEDYELLVSVSPERAPSLAEAMERTGTKLTLVGEVHSKVRGCVLEKDGSTVKLETVRGYDHFGGRS